MGWYLNQIENKQYSQVIPSSSDNCHSKCKKSCKTKLTNLGEDTFVTPIRNLVHFEITIYELWCKGLRDYKFWETKQMVAAALQESKYG